MYKVHSMYYVCIMYYILLDNDRSQSESLHQVTETPID
jgi:hypothetical protein